MTIFMLSAAVNLDDPINHTNNIITKVTSVS